MEKTVTSIKSAFWKKIKESKKEMAVWVVFVIILFFLGVSVGLPNLAIVPLAVFLIRLSTIYAAARKKFWKNFAKNKGWEYKGTVIPKEEEALILNEGHSTRIHNLVEGEIDGYRARVFEVRFYKGHGKHKRTYNYTAFGLRFKGKFPHLYLNSFNNGTNIRGNGVHISLPEEFEHSFKLYGPEEYEIEALQIFTPDILEYFVNQEWPYDIEFVDRELLIYRHGLTYKIEQLEEMFNKFIDITRFFTENLDNMDFEPIKDHPYFL